MYSNKLPRYTSVKLLVITSAISNVYPNTMIPLGSIKTGHETSLATHQRRKQKDNNQVVLVT